MLSFPFICSLITAQNLIDVSDSMIVLCRTTLVLAITIGLSLACQNTVTLAAALAGLPLESVESFRHANMHASAANGTTAVAPAATAVALDERLSKVGVIPAEDMRFRLVDFVQVDAPRASNE